MSAEMRARTQVLGVSIDAVALEPCVERIAAWAARGESRYVCLCNAHSVVTARRDAGFARVLAGADLALPDGAPIAWRMRRRGFPAQQRLSGPDVMWPCCARAATADLPVFLFGSTPATLAGLTAQLRRRLPALRVAGTLAPPFRPMTPAEDAAIAAQINASGARLVFVGIGCPKQERWMARQRGRIHAVMLGVGAAFDFHAGAVPRAPRWMQRAGLEWLFRLASEPRRLWRRYLVTNTLFVGYLLDELWRARRRT